MDIAPSLTPVGACYFWVWLNPGTTGYVYLANDAGSWQTGLAVGASGTSENSQCKVDAGNSSIMLSGSNSIILNLAISFKAAYAGEKTIYTGVTNTSGLYSTWQQRGTWTVTTDTAPSTVSVSPSSGSGYAQNFTFTFSDPDGASELIWTQVNFSPNLAAANSCWVFWYKGAGSGTLHLIADDGVASSSGSPGDSTVLQNSQCSLSLAASSVTVGTTTLTEVLALTFKAAFAGTKNIFMYTSDGTLESPWVLKGSWTATAPPPPGFTISATPVSAVVYRGSPARYNVAVTPQNGFSGSVSFSVSGLPSGHQGSFSPPLLSKTGQTGNAVC